MLTNAIYFKGDWQTQFDKAQTKDEDFHLSPAQTMKAPLMHREGGFNYFDGGTFQASGNSLQEQGIVHDRLPAQGYRRSACSGTVADCVQHAAMAQPVAVQFPKSS